MLKTETSSQSGLLSTADIARQHGVHVRTVHRWVEKGQLTPTLKAPGKTGALLFHPDDVARLAVELEKDAS